MNYKATMFGKYAHCVAKDLKVYNNWSNFDFFLLRCKTIEKREKNRKIVDGERDLRERLGFLICDWRDLRESQSLTFN